MNENQGEFDITGREGQNRAIGETHCAEAKNRNSLPAEEYFVIGETHPVWPEWRWDGEMWRKT